MITASYPIYARRYAGWDDTLLLEQEVDATPPLTGTVWEPLDLTGYTARMMVRTRQDDTAPILATLDTATTGITIDGAAGEIALHMDDTLTGVIPDGRWWYDLRLVPPVGDASYLIAGPFDVTASVTTP